MKPFKVLGHRVMLPINNDEENKKLTERIIGIAFQTYNILGPGFSERIYQNLFAELLQESDLKFIREKWTKLLVHGKNIGGHKVDFLIENTVVVELKCRNEIFSKDLAQVLNYLKVNQIKIGLILCFSKAGVKIKRLVL
jgi:GxxExxY protein